MATCTTVYAFLKSVQSRNVTTTLPDPDLAALAQAGWIGTLSADAYATATRDAAQLEPDRASLVQGSADRQRLAAQVAREQARPHSILFHFEGKEKQQAEIDLAARDAAALKAEDQDLSAKQQQFNALLAQRALVDSMVAFPGGYVGLTSAGVLQVRDLGVRMYRAADLDFAAYWQQTQKVQGELTDIGARGAGIEAQLVPRLPSSDRSYLWAIAIGLARAADDPNAPFANFLSAYQGLGRYTYNDENRLMASEVLTATGRPAQETVPVLGQLLKEVEKAGVPKVSAVGVASILLFGRRQDGSFATPQLSYFLQQTRSFESAALLAILNRPVDELSAKFAQLRALFRGWGFQPSEDSELAASYLTISDLPVEGISTKLTILTRGLIAYLQYPLVAAAILAAIPVLEANDTLNLLEHAYEVIGPRAMPMTQAEILCLAVRMVHEIRDETIRGLDSTQAAAPAPARPMYYGAGPRFFFVPVAVLHGSYYSTFGGMGGVHPGHVHAFGGGALG